MNLAERYLSVRKTIPANVTLVAVSKFHPVNAIKAVYDAGQRVFGENRVQELVEKQPQLPSDIEWHLIGTLQTNKVKYIAGFVSLIHSVDSLKLLTEIDKQAKKHNRRIDCLLEIHIGQEATKHGLSFAEAEVLLEQQSTLPNIKIVGVMGMATNTDDMEQVRKEFKSLAAFYNKHKEQYGLKYLSMGMSGDYQLAIEEGSNMVRIGSSIYGERQYA